MLTTGLRSIFLTSRTHQGTEDLYHFAQKTAGVLPGNGLFIIAGGTFLFLFLQAKKKREIIINLEHQESSLRDFVEVNEAI